MTLMTPMIPSVVAAFRGCGRRNACTPSAMASTPVRAVAPEENARRIRNSDSACVSSSGRCALSACGQPPMQLAAPATSVAAIITTNPYVGTANTVPASRAPRRFATVTRSKNAIAISMRYRPALGAAEITATVPAVTDTATVSV